MRVESYAMFDLNRAAHCRGVAILMHRLAPTLGLDADRMTLLGWIHDLGYLTGHADTHAPDLGRLLEAEGYAYAGAAGRHGTDRIDYDDPADVLLDIADMSVDGAGLLVSFDERVRDVADRWGAAYPAGRHVPPYHVAAIHVHGRPVGMRIHADDETPMRPARSS